MSARFQDIANSNCEMMESTFLSKKQKRFPAGNPCMKSTDQPMSVLLSNNFYNIYLFNGLQTSISEDA